MAKEGSVAPKERVNIRYTPAGDAEAREELPLKLLMVGDYTQRPDETPLEDRKVIDVSKDNFNDVMKGLKLETSMTVKNVLSAEEGAEMAVNLKHESMKDFEPESVVHQVPELKKLLDLRNALMALRSPLGEMPAFRKKLAEILGDDEKREKLLKELGIGAEGQ